MFLTSVFSLPTVRLAPESVCAFTGIRTSRLFLEFDELVTSLLCMKDIEIYIKRFPYRDADISSLRYQKYHIESHLNEIYLFQERVEAFLNFIKRRYRKSPIITKINVMAHNILALIKTSLQNVILVRGDHVHSRRFTNDDFDRLTFLEIMKKSEAETFAGLYELEYKQARKKWAKAVQVNNLAMEQLLNMICKELYSVLFDENGQIIYPDTR
ncbi:MAG: hypothetical protein AB1453_12670 [Chloroflexota bacterium]